MLASGVRSSWAMSAVIVRRRESLCSSEAAIEFFTDALASCRDIGYRRGEAVNLSNLANALYLRGQVGDALRTYAAAAAVFGSMDMDMTVSGNRMPSRRTAFDLVLSVSPVRV